MKKILGLDLGTNSIGWALIEKTNDEFDGKILGAGCRIIPMSQDILDNFGSGVSVSQTAERTRLRSARRLRERGLLRRERMHRVLNILGFLPPHYASEIDFENKPGQFIAESEPKLAYRFDVSSNKPEFIFKDSFNDMLADFARNQPQLVANNKKVPYDWTIYYLRKRALTEKIEKEELAWLLLHFNQKRGYYQLRGEEEEEDATKRIEFHALKVVEVTADEPQRGKSDIWYNVILENGWVYRRSSKNPLFDWKGKIQEFIVTTDLNDDGSVQKNKDGQEKRSFKAVDSEKDWIAIKKSTEEKIEASKKTVGEYIYNTLLRNPTQKIRGKLVRTIERKFYKEELRRILEKQQIFHAELQDIELYNACLEELYEHNEPHRKSIEQKDFVHLFLNDIIFYQRPLKSKKSLIGECKFETRHFIKDGKVETQRLKGIAKSHPLFQELRVWKFVQDLRIYEREKQVNGKLETDVDVTLEFLKTVGDRVALFDWLNERKEINQKAFLKYPPFALKKNAAQYRWNYVEDKTYPCNETLALITSRLEKVQHVPENFRNKENEEALWHILYSVEDKNDLEKALSSFARKHGISEDFTTAFKKLPPFKKEYGAYSAKAIKKILPLMRLGKYWSMEAIHPKTRERIEKILTGEYDETIRNRVREKALNLATIQHFQGLPEWLTSYIVYDRHAEDSNARKWTSPDKIDLLPQHSLRNPIVEQVINETLRVVQDIWKEYGNGAENFFNEIHVELGREMKNTKADREKISRQVTENENTNLRIKALLTELLNDGIYENVRPYSPSQQDILKIYEEGALSAKEGNIPDEILKISKLAQPTSLELARYKLWMEQKYRSPYTGETIPLTKLFTPAYEIEHIIPQARYYDNSFSNKVICESAVNKLKDNCTAFEFIQNEGGRIVNLGLGKEATILNKEAYEKFIKDHYGKSRGKMKKLLMEDVPESFIQRQMNDTRYITRTIKGLLSHIVREENEQESTSKNVIISQGTITSSLKQDWGLNDVWNEIIYPRFERLNQITNSNNFGEWTNKAGKRIFQTQVPLNLQKGFSKKRIDHRHHALDALIVACTSREHINYLNNESALGKRSREEKDKKRYDLRSTLCFKQYNDSRQKDYKWAFNKPWATVTQDVRDALERMVISFKQNQRVINKTVNQHYKWVNESQGPVKKQVKQSTGESWAIRKSLHKDTVSGLVKLKLTKTVSLASALDDWKMIVDKALKKHVHELTSKGYDKKRLVKHFKDSENRFHEKDISRVEIYYWDIGSDGNGNNAATRVKIDEKFNRKMIGSVTDTGIQKIMLRHLEKYDESSNNEIIEHPELAFSPEGLDEMNKNLVVLNHGKPHQPIYRVRKFEPRGNKFRVGQKGNKKDKYVEADDGTNLFFAIYANDQGKRSYETIPLNIVIERQKQGLSSVPEINEAGARLLTHLSPNDLVYVPSDGELNINFNNLTIEQVKNIYKMVSATGSACFFVKHTVALPIFNKNEFSPSNKMEKTITGTMIKGCCIKLRVDRMGKIKRS